MVKRKQVETIEPASEMPDVPVEAVLTPEPEPIEAAPEPEPETRYTVHNWSSFPLYQCSKCPYDSFSLPAMIEHYERRHRPVDVIPPSTQIDTDAMQARRRARRIRSTIQEV